MNSESNVAGDTAVQAEKPEQLYIATNAAFPGYWGSHKDGWHHAIVECLRAGASVESVFVVYEAYKGCYFDGMGNSVYLVEHGNPFEAGPEGVYDAAGQWLGSNLAEVAKEVVEDRWNCWQEEHPLIGKETIANLKRHHKQALEENA